MKIKICGMRNAENITQILELKPDFMGFIFSEKSPRYIGEELSEDLLKSFPKTTQKVGVFVNAGLDMIIKNVKKYQLDLVQLHGEELPDYCQTLRNKGISIIKVFLVDKSFNFSRLNNYKPHCDYFLFDTKGENPGGNGVAFDWEILKNYDNEKPFFLSGGINPDSILNLKNLPANLNLFAIDINSRFETEPGLKNVKKIKEFIAKLKPVLQES